ncbi:MAG: alpha/beta hydrolase [Saprospiraceae bacterium]|nr:alpha/beta hydrolase [Saprospiraceae bacterium]
MTYIPGEIQTHDGLTLATKVWPAAHSKANIVFVHGYLEHCNRYDHIAQFFNNHGYSFYAYDQRAHGLSDGDRSYLKDISLLVQDLDQFTNQTISADQPFYYLCHSMGGLIVLSQILLNNGNTDNLKGLVMSAPFIRPSKDLAPLLQKVSHILGLLLPRLKTLPADPQEISRDPSVVKNYIEDPLIYHGRVHARSAQQLLKQMKLLRPHYKDLSTPYLLMHGTNDKLSEFEGSVDLHKESVSEDKQFMALENFKHDLMNELGSHKILQSIVNWMDGRI